MNQQLVKLKRRLDKSDTDDMVLDNLLSDLLEDTGNIICDIRNSNIVEPKYLGIQVRMAVELYNKMGAEGQLSHNEQGLSRSYSNSDISGELLNQITPVAKGIDSDIRVIG